MPPSPRRILADLLGAARLGADGVATLADLVEHMHHEVVRRPRGRRGEPGGMRGISGVVYGGVRSVSLLVRGALEAATPEIGPATGAGSTVRRDAVVAALNGVVGDHLVATRNPLALAMRLLHDGRDAAGGALPRNGRIVLMVHGLCMGPRQWRRNGHDHGEALARDGGFAPVYVQYNSGLHVAENGRALADALEDLVHAWPVQVEELVVVAHSMGGLVIRSAAHQAAGRGHAWPRVLRRVVFLGTPHHGSHLERGGQRLHLRLRELPWVAALSRLGEVRSAGITDLRHGNLLDDDRPPGADRFVAGGDTRRAVPLPSGVECHAIAAAANRAEDAGREARLGDGFVPVPSAHGVHPDPAFDLALPPERRWVGRGMHHFDLLDRPEVYAEIATRLGCAPVPPAAGATQGIRT